MDIATYRKKEGLTQAQLADQLTAAGSPATQSLISQWESGDVRVPPERWSVIEQVTKRKVTRRDLRPDIFPAGTKNAA
jgi:DNA-binding transcriptional regulator YdaS (Cro superfamily)